MLDRTQVFKLVKETFDETIRDKHDAEVTEDVVIEKEYELDSMDYVELALCFERDIEHQYGLKVYFSPSAFDKVKTIGDVVDVVLASIKNEKATVKSSSKT